MLEGVCVPLLNITALKKNKPTTFVVFVCFLIAMPILFLFNFLFCNCLAWPWVSRIKIKANSSVLNIVHIYIYLTVLVIIIHYNFLELYFTVWLLIINDQT